MGQVALGLRSLAYRLVVFVIMAAMLAWILGGTLWPRPQSVIQPDVATLETQTYGWRVTVDQVAGDVQYALCRRTGDAWVSVAKGGPFAAATPLALVKTAAGTTVLESSVWTMAGQPQRLTVDRDGAVVLTGEVASTP